MEESRIIASYLIEPGINEIGDREIGLDEYAYNQVDSIEQGRILIESHCIDGCGNILEQVKNKFGVWDDVVTHHVDQGYIYHVDNHC